MSIETRRPPTADRLLKANRRLRKIIGVLTTIVVTIIGTLIHSQLFQNYSPNFAGVNDDGTANPHMHNYRKGLHLKRRSTGVYYDPAVVRKYMESTFEDLVTRQVDWQRQHHWPDSAKYQWKVGFYWMMKKDSTTQGSGTKLDFYVIPTLVLKKAPFTVLDYYDDKDSIYDHRIEKSAAYIKTPTGKKDGNAYDEGQLWP